MLSLKLTNLSLESYNSVTVVASASSAPNQSHIWSIYKGIAEAKTLFRECSVSNVRRKLNSVAHSLAKQTSSSGVCNRWFELVPYVIVDLEKKDDVNLGYE